MRPQTLKSAFHKLIIFASILLIIPNVFAQPGNTKMAQIDIEIYLKTIAMFTEAIKENPRDAQLYYGRGANYAWISRFDEALEDYAKAIELNKKYDEAYVGRGYVYLAKKQYDEAINAFTKAIEINPLNKEAVERREQSLAEFNKAAAFIQKIDEQLKLKPLDPELYSLRAETYIKIGRKKEAEADLKKVEELNAILDKNVSAECASTDYDCQINIYTEKIKITRDIRIPKNLNMLYANRGVTYYEKGDLDGALSDFRQAEISNGSIRIDMSLYIGKINLRKGKYDEVLKSFRCDGMSRNAEVDLLCGEAHLYKANYDKAFDFFEEAISLSPGIAKAYLGRGTVYLERARTYAETENDASQSADAYRKAIKDFDSVIEIELAKTPSEVYVKRAKAYERLGEQGKADADRVKAEEIAEKP